MAAVVRSLWLLLILLLSTEIVFAGDLPSDPKRFNSVVSQSTAGQIMPAHSLLFHYEANVESPPAQAFQDCSAEGGRLAYYGCDFYSASSAWSYFNKVRLRGGISEFSSKGSLGLQVIFSW